ncbi:MAG: D-alanyl-D-alanine carboxypeptidase/D-alanyl-D-alanine-endopeptidase [Gammaproteobacteria bacterium]|nr:D-alanyl-D-alanine carboxypeptidase/D-alanyl-D-alanine-endopeptidase [Gammaproteobacteria bacterium]
MLLPMAVFAADSLPASVKNALKHRGVPEDSISVYVEDLSSGDAVVSWNAETARNPASVVKLVTTLVALDLLGPAYRWQTEFYALGEIDEGRLDGDLLIKGYGDPFLVTERMWQMLRQLRLTGLDSIGGDLLIDDSFFAVAHHDPAAFDREPLRAYNVAPNALLTNFKVVRYIFEPDGNGVRIGTDPELENLEISNRLQLARGPCRGYQRGITIIPNDDVSEVTFTGKFPNGCAIYAMDRAALEHNAFTYGLFRTLWAQSGGELEGTWRIATAPADTEPLMVFESSPLSDVITKINKHSNNVMARQLLFTLAAERFGAPGTEENGRKVISDWLAARGLDVEAFHVENGAGLSRAARMTARHLGDMLSFAYRQPYMPEYVSSLSLSGTDGTLSRRFRRNGLKGKAHIKTGSLDHVSAIAGYFQAKSGRRFVVVSLHNYTDIHRGYGEEAQQALLEWLDHQ